MKKLLFLITLFVGVHAYTQNFEWAKQMGGQNIDEGNAINVDNNGNVYSTGLFEGTVDFDPSSNTFNLTSNGGYDIFISKLDNNGNFVWAKQFGANGQDVGYSIATDNNGNLYATGHFMGTIDFDPGIGTYNLTSNGNNDIFILKLNSSGNFIWAKQFGGTNNDIGRSVVVDDMNNIYTTGNFTEIVDFDPNGGVYNLTANSNSDIFISKLDSNGSFIWAKQIAGTNEAFCLNLTLDTANNIYYTGYFTGTYDFDPSTNNYNLTSTTTDVFVSKLDSNGNFVWAKQIEGNAPGIYSHSITTDDSSNIYITGYFYDTIDFDPSINTYNLTSNGSSDIFISKLDVNGNFIWAKNLGGSSGEIGLSIKSDSYDNIYTTGYFQGNVDFDPNTSMYNLTSLGNRDIFILKLNNNGNFVGANQFGGINDDYGNEIAIDELGNIYLTGYFTETVDFDPSTNTFQLTSFGSRDIYVLKLSEELTRLNEILNITELATIYPNPTLQYLTIKIESEKLPINYNILTINGQLIKRGYLKEKTETISLEEVPQGIYFITFTNDNQLNKTIKLIKQ
jgi:hypothetical protein